MPLYVELFFLATSSLLFNNEDMRIPTALQNIPDNNIHCDLYKTKRRHTQFLADLIRLEVAERHISLFLPFDDALHGGETWSY